MKSIYLYLCLFMIGFITSSCDKGFVEVNKNPVSATSLDPALLFTNAQLGSDWRTLQYHESIVQQIVTPFGSRLQGGNYNLFYEEEVNGFSFYTGPLKSLYDIIYQTKDAPTRSNLYNMARIMKAYLFQVLVDTYGDVPYSEAGLAYISGIYLPKYDNHETIYDDLLKELSEATSALDASQAIESNDLFYGGDISKWKKLGNSLLLRVAMRYTKVNISKAQQYVAIATNPANGGLMSSNEDNAKIIHSSSYNNPNAVNFQGTERGNYYLTKPFVDILQTTNDPRLPVISVKYQFPANDLATVGTENTTPAEQLGMLMGYNDATISTAPGYPGKSGAAWKYSQVNRRTFGKIDAPGFLVTYSQTQLLLAEAAQRGWYAGSASDLYNAGVKGNMDQMQSYDASALISLANQNSYLAAHPYNPATGLDQINTQYWISSFLNGPEVWANFRRSGFPALTPNPYPSADPTVKGGFIHRLLYPTRERSVNIINLEAAVTRMGPDTFATRLFWDN